MGLIVFVIFLFIVLAGGWIFLSTLDINRYIPQVADAVAKATGRQLKIGHAGLGFSLNKGAVLELNNVSLSDDPRFSGKSFVTASRIVLSLDLRSALVEKSIVISDVTIIAPEVTVIRAKDGSINAATIGAPASLPASSSAKSAAVPSAMATAPLPSLLVKKFQVNGGIIHYYDRLFDPPIMLDIEKVSLDIRNFALNAPFDVVLSAAVFSAEPNLSVSGRAGVDIVRLMARLTDVKASLVFDKMLPARLNEALPMIKPAGFRQAKGSLNVQVKKAVLDVKGVQEFDAEAVVDATDAVLEGVNIFAAGLNSIPMFPDLANTVLADLPPETQEDIRRGVTTVDRLEVLMSAGPDMLTVKKAEMSTRDLAVSCDGVVRLAGDLGISAKLFIAPKLSQVLVNKVPDLGGLMKEDGRVYIPFSVSGPMIKPKVMPDLDYLTRKLLLGRGKQELEKVLGDPAVGKAVGELFNTIFKGK